MSAPPMREHHDGCCEQGLYDKFEVRRTDGQSEPGGRHEGCVYFPLDLTCDPAARDVLGGFADLIEHERPALAKDLRLLLAREATTDATDR